MKRLLLIFGLILPSSAYSHGGGLNSYGCHNQNSNSTYHCHQGDYDGQSFASEQAFFDAINTNSDPNPDPDPEPSSSLDYNRDDYLPDWADADGDCINTRHEVLIIESLSPVTLSSNGCSVLSGRWFDPLTGLTFTDPSDVDIDHHVPLAEAHDSGASLWPTSQKQAFANDMLMSEVLVAVDDATNSSKGARDPAEWLPPNSDYHCDYVLNWVEIKAAYGLTYDDAERTAIETILGTDISMGARSSSTGISTNTGSTDTRFGMGLRQSEECGYSTTLSVNDPVEITFSVVPELSDLNTPLDIILVAAIGSDLYSIGSTGQLVSFNGDGNQLVPFIGSVSLQESYSFTLFEGVLADPISVDIYVAYRTDQGELIYTPSPFSIIVN